MTVPRIRFTFWKAVFVVIMIAGAYVTYLRFFHGLGAATNLSDRFPWGLWIGFDVMCGVMLAAGGFTLTTAVEIFNIKRMHSIVRPTILTAFLGYLLVCAALMYDLGLPWNIWHPLVMRNPHSVMFEVAWCVMLYTTVLALEFSPIVLEHFNLQKPLRIIRFSLTTFRSSARSCAISSTTGATIRHGPHHGARKKSTSTGLSDSMTSAWKLLSVTSETLAMSAPWGFYDYFRKFRDGHSGGGDGPRAPRGRPVPGKFQHSRRAVPVVQDLASSEAVTEMKTIVSWSQVPVAGASPTPPKHRGWPETSPLLRTFLGQARFRGATGLEECRPGLDGPAVPRTPARGIRLLPLGRSDAVRPNSLNPIPPPDIERHRPSSRIQLGEFGSCPSDDLTR